MKKRKHTGTGDSKQCHSFGETVDRGAPLLPEQQEDRRDERTGVTDTYPPYEVGDVPAPPDGAVQVPLAGTEPDLTAYGDDTEAKHGHGDQEADPPQGAGFGLHRAADVFGYLMVVLIAYNERWSYLRFVLK